MTDLGWLEGKRAAITGGAGFLGSHLCDRLLDAGAQVVAIDNLITGRLSNVEHLFGRPGFTFVDYDVTNYLHVSGPLDAVLHFASPASPVDYLELPIQTLKVGSLGTHKALGLAKEKGARFLLASTSEVYGDPQVNPQPETYWGHVNPVGPRGVYDEAKRFAEALTYAYARSHDVDVRVVRIFNSILADEQVLYDDGRELRRETVGELAARIGHRRALSGYTVPAFDQGGAITASETIALEGHPTSARCYEVRTRYGRSIRVTGDHSLFAEGLEGEPVARAVRDLAPGDRVAIAGRVDVVERDRAQVDLRAVWQAAGRDPWDLLVRAPGLGSRLWDHRQEVLPLYARRSKGKTPRQSSWGRLTRDRDRDQVPVEVAQRIGLDAPPDATVRIRTSGRTTALPLLVEVSDDLLWFLGLYVAEGTWHRSDNDAFIAISTGADLLERAAKVARSLGLHVAWSTPAQVERASAIFLHSQLLLLLLNHLGFDGNQKHIPGWILGLPLSRLKHFIEGYREGDGVHSGKKLAEGKRHEFSTTSDRLKDDLVVALARFGLVPSVGSYETTLRQKTGDRRYPFWRLTLANVAPWSPLEWDGGVVQGLNARRTGDLVWARVTDIVEVPATDYVYDFCVPGRENFWAGTGVMAHNTYGERMRPDDGRAVPTFIGQALAGEPLTVHGDGSQTRSLCYVDDLIEGISRLLCSGFDEHPVNLGNPQEVTVRELAETIIEVAGSSSELTFTPRPTDDPEVRRPDTTVAERELNWKAEIRLEDGLRRTVAWFRQTVG